MQISATLQALAIKGLRGLKIFFANLSRQVIVMSICFFYATTYFLFEVRKINSDILVFKKNYDKFVQQINFDTLDGILSVSIIAVVFATQLLAFLINYNYLDAYKRMILVETEAAYGKYAAATIIACWIKSKMDPNEIEMTIIELKSNILATENFPHLLKQVEDVFEEVTNMDIFVDLFLKEDIC